MRRHRLTFFRFNDDYVLGVVCAKTGLIRYALNNLPSLRHDRERKALFNYGAKDAINCKLEDIAQELSWLRNCNPVLFDQLVSKKVGSEGLKKIQYIIRNKSAYKVSSVVIHSIEKWLRKTA